MGMSPEAEPSPADLAGIVASCAGSRSRSVFFETLVSPRLAETLSREVGATPLLLNPVSRG